MADTTTVQTNPTSPTQGESLPPMGKQTVIPSLPAPPSDPTQVKPFLDKIKEVLEVYEGKRGSKYDSVVTWRDMFDHGLVDLKINGTRFSGQPGSYTIIPAGVSEDYSLPPAPENLAGAGAIENIILTWKKPTFTSFSYTEVWRSDYDNIGTASLVGTTTASVYSDTVKANSTMKYYWVRFVNQNNVVGPFNAGPGVAVHTSEDPEDLIRILSDYNNTKSKAPFFQVDEPTVINGKTIPAGTYIKSAFIADATISNAMIRDAAIDNAKIANLDAAKITSGLISADRLDANTITSKVLSVDWAKITNAVINWAQITGVYITDAQIQSLSANKIVGLDAQLNNVTARHLNVQNSSYGARMTFTDDVIKIYDSSNRLRVQIGNLDL